MNDKKLTVVVERNRWLRGGLNLSYLFDFTKPGRMCCVGFVCKELGVTKDEMVGIKSVLYLFNSSLSAREKVREFVEEYKDHGKSDKFHENEIYEINDRYDLDDKTRESLLKQKFEKLDIDIRFV